MAGAHNFIIIWFPLEQFPTPVAVCLSENNTASLTTTSESCTLSWSPTSSQLSTLNSEDGVSGLMKMPVASYTMLLCFRQAHRYANIGSNYKFMANVFCIAICNKVVVLHLQGTSITNMCLSVCWVRNT